jgi:amidohydrolase
MKNYSRIARHCVARAAVLATICIAPTCVSAQPRASFDTADIAKRAALLETKLIAWRRDIHEHPELGEQETRTAALIADHLRTLGMEVRTGVGVTGVVAVLKGGKPGAVVALRADMDALPVKEAVALPFASKARSKNKGAEVDVMHACGHDAHVAILMATAELLAGMRELIPGTVKFIFQPAEEGPSLFTPDGSQIWGAKRMIAEGAMDNPKPNAVFGLHVAATLPAGRIAYRPGTLMAGADELHITVNGKQTHGAQPHAGVDPIVVSAQIIMGLQTVISRQINLTKGAAVVTIGTINGGSRFNIIPDKVEMGGTLRFTDEEVRTQLHERVTKTASLIAQSSGATADTKIVQYYGPTVNPEGMTERALPSLKAAADNNVIVVPMSGAAEDFSEFAKAVPGFFFFLGITPKDKPAGTAAPNHSPSFFIDESALIVGVRALSALALDFLAAER